MPESVKERREHDDIREMLPLATTFTLSPPVARYIGGRERRGEITCRTARDLACRLGTLDRSFGYSQIGQMDRKAIETWMEETFPPLRPASRSAYLSTAKVFARWLVAEGLLASDPTSMIKGIRRPRAVPRAQSARSVAALFAACSDGRDDVILSLMVGLGLRCGEVASARREDYDPDDRVLVVLGKNSDERAIPVPEVVASTLAAYHGADLWSPGPLVRRHDKAHIGLTASSISQIVTKIFWRAGLKRHRYDGRSAHALRHTCASDVFGTCHDLRVVQALLGHRDLSTTAIYLRHADLGQIREAMEGREYRAQPGATAAA